MGPVVGALLISQLSWHRLFLVNVPIGVLGLVVGLRTVPRGQAASTGRIDRPGRKPESIARRVEKLAAQRGDAENALVDLADHDLPHLDEPAPALLSQDCVQPATRRRAETIDGFVFVMPECNHSTTGVLKNALDHLYPEWINKAPASALTAGCARSSTYGW